MRKSLKITSTMLTNIKGTHVHFNLTPTIIYKPKDLTDDLREYRKDIYQQKKVDAARLERLLSPILTHEHRQKIQRRLNASESIKNIA